MSGKCFLISSCLCFLVITVLILCSLVFLGSILKPYSSYPPKLILWNGPFEQAVEIYLDSTYEAQELKSPTVESFIRASTAGNSLKGLAVYLNLTNACQTLDDVSKAKIQVHKIALVNLVNAESTCTLQDLAENVQNAGYSVLIYFGATATAREKNSKKKVLLMIPVVRAKINDHPRKMGGYQFLSSEDRTDVDIVCSLTHRPETDDELSKMESYLKRLYFWFLFGPLITFEWMRRTRKFCWLSHGQDVHRDIGEQTTENERNAGENEIRTMEEGENGTEESNQELPLNYQGSCGSNPEREVLSQRSEEQPLLVEYTREPRHSGNVRIFSYIILIIVALPIAISSGGLSFFRFDDRAPPALLSILAKSFLSDVQPQDTPIGLISIVLLLIVFLWSPFQIFCFLLYSRLACTTTWVVPINYLKLIRSEWFASNISLLILAVVVPVCTSSINFSIFATYNTVCTVCNLLFIIIVNKHNFVTRYVFYISVCMIFAYMESSIVAVFYFVLNSEGSLNNLKLTALRTLAIGLTLKVSFSSSMHIIRKLNKPMESLFEGLSEK